jgi:hypothetical protein
VEYPSFGPEAALQLFHAFVYCMAYICVGGAVIVLSVYIVLVCSEMFSSEPRSKTQRAEARQSARRVPVAEGPLVLSSTETVILSAREESREGNGTGDSSSTWRANSDDSSCQSGN